MACLPFNLFPDLFLLLGSRGQHPPGWFFFPGDTGSQLGLANEGLETGIRWQSEGKARISLACCLPCAHPNLSLPSALSPQGSPLCLAAHCCFSDYLGSASLDPDYIPSLSLQWRVGRAFFCANVWVASSSPVPRLPNAWQLTVALATSSPSPSSKCLCNKLFY